MVGAVGRLAAACASTSGPRRWDRWFLAIGAPFGVLLLIFLPPAISPDGQHHLLRIDQVAHGRLVPPIDGQGFAFARPDPCIGAAAARFGVQYYEVPWHPADGVRRVRCSRQPPVNIGNTAINSPVSYTPLVIGYGVGRMLGDAVLAMWLARITGFLTYLSVCWLALRLAPRGRPFLFLVALLPTSMTLATTPTADTVPIELGILAVALVLRLRVPRASELSTDPTRRLLWGIAGTFLLLALSKNVYALMVLLALLIPLERFSSRARWLGYQVATVGAVVVAAGAWILGVVNRVRLVTLFSFVDSFSQRSWVQNHPWQYLHLVERSLIGRPTLIDHTLPGVVAHFRPDVSLPGVIPLLAVAVAVVALRTDHVARELRPDSGSPRARFAAVAVPLVVSVAVLGLVVYGESIAFTPLSMSQYAITYLEGRFFVPIVPLMLLAVPSISVALVDRSPTGRVSWLVPVGSVGLAGWFLLRVWQLYY